jgi:hypothetical protein
MPGLAVSQNCESRGKTINFLNEQDESCPLAALRIPASVVPALANVPSFSWRDTKGNIRPMAKIRAMERITSILVAWGWGLVRGGAQADGAAHPSCRNDPPRSAARPNQSVGNY